MAEHLIMKASHNARPIPLLSRSPSSRGPKPQFFRKINDSVSPQIKVNWFSLKKKGGSNTEKAGNGS